MKSFYCLALLVACAAATEAQTPAPPKPLTATQRAAVVAPDSLVQARALQDRAAQILDRADSIAEVANDSLVTASAVIARQLPRLGAIPCDSLRKMLRFDGSRSTNTAVQKALAVCTR